LYKSPGDHGDFDIESYGRDGQPGGEGNDADIVNW
jgi:general secretion pathway protein G